MGVDFLICNECEETFPDCMSYIRCNGCWRKWCSEDCAAQGGYLVEDEETEEYEKRDSCKFCRRETVDDQELLTFLLKSCSITKEEAIKLCLEEKH